MKNIIDTLKNFATKAIVESFPEDLDQLREYLPADITQSTQDHFGHYQCNSALKLAKPLRKNPRQIADILKKNMQIHSTVIQSLDIAGPGFINITMSQSFLEKELNQQLLDERLGVPHPDKKKKIIVEFSSPNVAKELHVGHLRSTIIGECLARLFEFLGHDVMRLNHVGDWGTQFGMLIAFLKRYHPEVISAQNEVNVSHLMAWYRESKKLFDHDEGFKKEAQLEVVSLQSHDKTSLEVWRRICEISREAFQKIYALLDVKIQERGESYYNPMLPEVIKELGKNHLMTEDQGAKCIFLDEFKGQDGRPFPMIVQKSDGGYNYSTTDMAAIRQRAQIEHADRIIYVVDAGQSLHFQMLFKAASLAGFYDPQKTKPEHVAFGVVLGSDGKKFKTRSGETEKLIDLLIKAVEKAKDILKEKLPDVSKNELENYAKILGIDAVKYADLSCHRLKDYIFSYDRMLKFEGNTAAFLLYAYVRINSIEKKVGTAIESLIGKHFIKLTHASEITLGLHLRRFGEALDMVDKELLPNRLTDYLYQLAEKFHAFFRDCRVEGSEHENSRLLLCGLVRKILKQGLYILGLKTLDKM